MENKESSRPKDVIEEPHADVRLSDRRHNKQMRARHFKAKVWEVEWEDHIIRVEESGRVAEPYRLSVDGKMIASGGLWFNKLRGCIQEDGEDTRRYIECFFCRRSVWHKELEILRRKKCWFSRVLCSVYEEWVGDRIEIHIDVDGKAIYNSLFGTQKEIERANELLKGF